MAGVQILDIARLNKIDGFRQKNAIANARVENAQKQVLTAFGEMADLLGDFVVISTNLESVPEMFYKLYLYGEDASSDVEIQTIKKWLQRLAMTLTSCFQFLVPERPHKKGKVKNFFTMLATSPLAVWELIPITLDVILAEANLLYKVQEQFATYLCFFIYFWEFPEVV